MAGHPGRVGAEQEISQRWTMRTHHDVVDFQVLGGFDNFTINRAIFNYYPGLHCLGYRIVGNFLEFLGSLVFPLL